MRSGRGQSPKDGHCATRNIVEFQNVQTDVFLPLLFQGVIFNLPGEGNLLKETSEEILQNSPLLKGVILLAKEGVTRIRAGMVPRGRSGPCAQGRELDSRPQGLEGCPPASSPKVIPRGAWGVQCSPWRNWALKLESHVGPSLEPRGEMASPGPGGGEQSLPHIPTNLPQLYLSPGESYPPPAVSLVLLHSCPRGNPWFPVHHGCEPASWVCAVLSSASGQAEAENLLACGQTHGRLPKPEPV